LGEWNINKIALKKLRNDDDVTGLVAEVRIARKLQSPNVACVYGVALLKEEVYVMIQCCENGDLRSYLKVNLEQQTNKPNKTTQNQTKPFQKETRIKNHISHQNQPNNHRVQKEMPQMNINFYNFLFNVVPQ
jgi:hypothetical protein